MEAVTARLSVFVSALTQFLNSHDIRQLACVSILDHRSTEELWTMGIRLLAWGRPSLAANPATSPASSPASPGQQEQHPHLMDVLRHGRLPQSYAVAWSLSLTACKQYMQVFQGTLGGARTAFGFKGLSDFHHCWVGFDNSKVNVLVQSGDIMPRHRDFLRLVSQVLELDSTVPQRLQIPRSFGECAYCLHCLLLEYGSTFDFVVLHDVANAAAFIHLWFHLNVAPILPFVGTAFEMDEVKSLPEFQQHTSRIEHKISIVDQD
jgi:hypothetical protein